MYGTSSIKSRGLYNFYPIFHWGLYSKVANITDNLCTKQENSSIKSMVYNQEQFQIKRRLQWRAYSIFKIVIYMEYFILTTLAMYCLLSAASSSFLLLPSSSSYITLAKVI